MEHRNDKIETLFETTLDMKYEAIEALLESLDPITSELLLDRLIGNADVYPSEDLL